MNYKNLKYIFLIGLIVFISIHTYFNKKQNVQSLQQATRIEKTTIVESKSSVVKPEKKGAKKSIKKVLKKFIKKIILKQLLGA